MQAIKRFVERNMLGHLVNSLSKSDTGLDQIPDWLWNSIFEYFTHE